MVWVSLGDFGLGVCVGKRERRGFGRKVNA